MEVNNGETVATIEANNDKYCLQNLIEKFPLQRRKFVPSSRETKTNIVYKIISIWPNAVLIFYFLVKFRDREYARRELNNFDLDAGDIHKYGVTEADVKDLWRKHRDFKNHKYRQNQGQFLLWKRNLMFVPLKVSMKDGTLILVF